MNMRQVSLLVLAGTGLLSLTVAQALRGPGPLGAPVVGPASNAAVARQRLSAEGRVVTYPGAEVVVSAERAGRLVVLRVQEGQSVRRGELLAELDSEELNAALGEARAQMHAAEAELRLAEASRARHLRLAGEGIVAAQALEQATRDLETANAHLATARAVVNRQSAALAKTRILAPLGGVVTQRLADAGERVEAGTPLVTIADLTRLRIDAEADEADAARLATGASVRITVPGRPDLSWRGQVEELSDAVTLRRIKPQDPARPTDTRVLGVKVAFTEPHALRLGASVELQIDAR
jgi:RND family efflux transporter MFP subunit